MGVELPGHDFADDPGSMEDVPVIARRVCDEITERVSTPVLLWGHCAGTAPALETTRLLEEAGTPAERLFIGAYLLEETQVLRAEIAEVTEADNKTLLDRLRADNAYIELDALKPERADVVGRAYRHDVLIANAHLMRIHENAAAHRVRTPIEVVVARDDPSTAKVTEGYGDWREVSDVVRVHELEQGSHYFVSTRPKDVADVVRAACLMPARRD
jgi:surfactin synthase thioesterase subunit